MRNLLEVASKRIAGIVRGWDERDLASLRDKLEDPRAYRDGMLLLIVREYRALSEHNRQVVAVNPRALTSPLMIWVQGKGLFRGIRKQ
jgi:hypothetical protein